MKSPIWIFNSLFLLVLLFLFGYIGLYREKLSKKTSIKPIIPKTSPYKKELPKANIKRIYQRDLFGTYQPEVKSTIKPQRRNIKQVPLPPKEETPEKKPIKEVEFLKPLNITLKGIIFTTPEKSQAIIENNDTKKEKLYKSGDKVIDSHILRIFKDRIIILRSNGQQEIIYADKKKAKKALEKMQNSNWNDILEQKSKSCYIVDPENFSKRLNNLAELIDMLDLTTVFNKGESIGLRVGQLKENSLGKALGLETGDIVASINNISPTSTKNRVDIYNSIIKSKINDIIKVQIHRNQTISTINYILKKINSTNEIKNLAKKEESPIKNSNNLNIDKRIEILESKNKLKPIDKAIRKDNRRVMLKQGSKGATILDNLVI